MPVPNVTTGQLITESWGDAVADAINAQRRIWLPAAALSIVTGTPVLELILSRYGAYRLDATTATRLGGQAILPLDWPSTTVSFTAYFARIGAEAAGDVRLTRRLTVVASGGGGGDINETLEIDTSSTVTVAAQYILSGHGPGSVTVAPGDLVYAAFGRSGADGADTFTGNIHLLGIALRSS